GALLERGPEAGQPFAHCGRGERVRGHDQGVLAIVGVVARADADRPEAVFLVEPAGGHVRQADLERRLARAALDGAIQEPQEQPLADATAAPARIDGERRDVRLVDHDPQPAEADDLSSGTGHEIAREPVAEQLVPVGVIRPGHQEARSLDDVHRAEVVDRHRLDANPHRGSRDHATPPSGSVAGAPRGGTAYAGTRRSGSSNSPAASLAPPIRSRLPASASTAARPRSSAAASARPARSTATSPGRSAPPSWTTRGAAPRSISRRSRGPEGSHRRSPAPAASSASDVAIPT